MEAAAISSEISKKIKALEKRKRQILSQKSKINEQIKQLEAELEEAKKNEVREARETTAQKFNGIWRHLFECGMSDLELTILMDHRLKQVDLAKKHARPTSWARTNREKARRRLFRFPVFADLWVMQYNERGEVSAGRLIEELGKIDDPSVWEVYFPKNRLNKA
jgi:predicted nuclease with TOPRIM domain